MNNKKLDVCGFGHAPVDVIVNIDEGFLGSSGFIKGTCNLIDTDKELHLRETLPEYIIEPGGACANVLSGIGLLGGKCVFNSRISSDREGRFFRKSLEEDYSVAFSGTVDETVSSDKVYIFTTPDSERTFGSFYSVSHKMSPSDLDAGAIESTKICYLEGFMLNVAGGFEILKQAASLAARSDTLTAFCPNDIRMIRNHPEQVKELTGAADIVLLNESEAMELTGSGNAEDACRILAGITSCGSITRGPGGALFYSGENIFSRPAPELHAPIVNTNGAGDQFAAGFLFGLSRDMELEKCAGLALKCAAGVLSHPGARPPLTK